MKSSKGLIYAVRCMLALWFLMGLTDFVFAGGASAEGSQKVSVLTRFSDKVGWPKLVKIVKDKTGIDINVQPATTVYSDYVTMISPALVTGDSSYDIFDIDELLGATFIAAGFLEPITDVIKPVIGDFNQAWLEGISKGPDGNYYILQTTNVVFNLIANKGLFDAAGLKFPTTMDEYISAAQKLTKGDVYGVGAPFKQGGTLFNEIIRIIYGFGGDFYDWNNPNTQKAIQFLYDQIYTYKITPQAALGDEYGQLSQKFTDNKYGMMYHWEAGSDATKARLGRDVEIIPIPKFTTNRTLMGAWGFALSKYSKNKEAAKKVLSAIASREAMECMLEIENTPHLGVLNSPAADINPLNKYVNQYVQAGSLYPRPMPPTVNEIQTLMENNVSAYLSQQISLAECARNVNNGLVDLKP
jgi:multiple sugar transport system substrate-binding protein